METVEVVIRVPKDLYEGIECRNGELETEYVCDELMKAIDNGTVLPKGHGDLISRTEVLKKLHEYFDPLADGEDICPADIYHEINVLSKVIEADKDGE